MARDPWPGNIRELQHAVERALILSDSSTISAIELLVHAPAIHMDSGEMHTLDEMEKSFIIKSLEQNKGNVTQTAKTLGLTRTALYRRMKKHGI